MTPKEKAIAIIEKYELPLLGIDNYEDAVDCAIIAVDEILEATKVLIDRPEYSGIIYDSFWAKVKYELITLQND